MIIYAAGGETPAPWIAEASLAVDWAALNPSPDELAKLKAAGFASEQVPPSNFHKKADYVKEITLLPFYWGFDLGMDVSADEMVKVLNVIEQHADELAKSDPSFKQIGGGQMAAFQKKALEFDLRPRADPSGPRQVDEGKRRHGTASGTHTSPRRPCENENLV